MPTPPLPEDLALARARWAQIDAALDELLALPLPRRAAAIARVAAGDPALAAELRTLLASLDTGDSLLDHPASDLLAGAVAATPGLPAGTRLGPWLITAPLGQGGMGQVYHGRRADGQFEQEVAIKLARADSATAWQRFPLERQIVARLDHPGIARLIDGGIADSGQPYMVMELVAGQAITPWCAEHQAGLAQRLDLFEAVCEAVAYAHRHLVIHRDIKPSNVMVTDDARVKLLDFGIARLLDAVSTGATAELVLTPAYAAPEQVSGEPLSTATDVYALGLLLHELLTGAGAQKVEHLPMAAAIHAVLHNAPQSPSGVARATPDAPVAAAQLEGDLDAIVAKALRKEPEQRYPTVDALAADLARHRAHLPVQARRGTWAYTAGRALRRHRAVAAAAAVALLALAVGTGAVAWQARVARDEAERATAVKNFLVGVFRASAPAQAQGRDITAKELLAQGSARLQSDLRAQPLAMAELDGELGDIYNEMNDNEHALQHLNRALATFAAAGRQRSKEGLDALFHHGVVMTETAHWDEARADLERCLQWGLQSFGARHRWAVAAREKLAFIELELGHGDRALQIAREALAQPVGDDAVYDALRRLRVRSVMGQTQTNMDRYADAEATFARLLADAPQVPAFSVADVMVARLQMARAYHYDGDEAQAQQQMQALVPDMERVLGPHHLITRVGRQVLSQALTGLGRYDEAIAAQQANLEGIVPADGEDAAVERALLAVAFKRAGRFEEASEPALQALQFFDAKYAQPTARRELVRRTLGEVQLGLGRIDAGTKLIEAARDNGRRIDGYEKAPDWPATLDALAAARRLDGDWDQAQSLLDEACPAFARTNGASSLAYGRCAAQRAWVQAMRTPSSDDARQAYAQAAHGYAEKLAAGHAARADLALMQAELDERAGRGDAAARQAAVTKWQEATRRPWPGHLALLH